MKRFLLTGVLFLSLGQFLAHAQNNSRTTYTDDIYYSAEDAKKDAEKEAETEAARRAQAEAAAAARNENTYNSSGDDAVADGNYESYNRSYESDGDEYIDYNDDDYYYSSRMRRFNNNYYGFGYYTPFYDPFWYDPWYSPWYGPRSGFSLGIGWGGPYWSSCYGMSGWYGYPGFYSAWNYPYYAGWGGYYGGWGGYYGGGYYDGYYGGGNVRSVQYGPRTSFNGPRNGYRRDSYGGGSLRSSQSSGAGTRQVMRTTAPEQRAATDNYRGRAATNTDMRTAPDRSVTSPDRRPDNDMRMRNRFDNNAGSNDSRGATQQQMQAAPQQRTTERRGRFFQNLNNAFSNDNSRQQRAQPASEQRARQQSTSEQPAQRYQPAAQPSYQRSTPSSSPSRGGGSVGGSSGGGGRRR